VDSTGPAVITVVTAPACHFCDDAQDGLAELARQYRFTVTVVPAAGPAGQAATRQHRSGMFPLVLVDGVFFSAGRLPRRRLARLLAGRCPAPAKVS
jgi:hypothetical protein